MQSSLKQGQVELNSMSRSRPHTGKLKPPPKDISGLTTISFPPASCVGRNGRNQMACASFPGLSPKKGLWRHPGYRTTHLPMKRETSGRNSCGRRWIAPVELPSWASGSAPCCWDGWLPLFTGGSNRGIAAWSWDGPYPWTAGNIWQGPLCSPKTAHFADMPAPPGLKPGFHAAP